MRVSFPAADAAEAVTGEENGKESHEEEVNAIAPKGGDGTGIGFLVNPAQGWILTGRKEEAAMLFKAGVLDYCVCGEHPHNQSDGSHENTVQRTTHLHGDKEHI